MRPNPHSPPTPSLAVKIVTLLFSGGVASTAILHGAASGCGDPPAEPAPAPAPAPAPTPEPPPASAPAPAAALEPAPPAPDAKPSTGDVLPEQRYFGGAKSDADAWGAIQVLDPPPEPAKKKTRKRGER